MATTTPEGKVKDRITKLLKKHETYYFMPVQMGYGAPTLDYLGFHCGIGFAIEAKAPGRKPTKRQEAIIKQMKAAGTTVFVIDGKEEEFEQLDYWLTDIGKRWGHR